MKNDVNSPVSTCSSEISLSIGTTDSCIICFCSDEETESHDCNVCRKGSWKVCIECKEKLKKLKKCPVCASENDNYISESELDEIGRREDVGNIYSERRRVKKLWLNLISCIFFACLGFFSVFFLSDFYDNQNCILIYFIAIIIYIKTF